MSIAASILDRVRNLLPAPAKGTKATWGELFGNFVAGIKSAIEQAEKLIGPGNGGEKKAAVLLALDGFFESHIRPLDLPYIPAFIEPYVDNWLKSMLLGGAGTVIDLLVAAFNGRLKSAA